MENEAEIRISRMGPPSHLGPIPEICDVCHTDPPVIALENTHNKKYAWLCRSCLEKGYPEFAKDCLSVLRFNKDNDDLPQWSNVKNIGG